MPKKRILIVEDDKDISRLVRYNLEKAGYECPQVYSGEEAFAVLDKSSVSLIILDVMLPGMDGFEICRSLKQDPRLKNIPVIMLTAKGEEVDKVVGLELGADDYMVKPFSPRELVLRVKAVLRRGKGFAPSGEDILTVGDLTVDLPRHRVMVRGRAVELTPMEFKLLVTLMERGGRVQSRETLLADVWGIDADIYTRTIDTHIKRLREKLGGTVGKLIETVVGMGYRFKQDNDED